MKASSIFKSVITCAAIGVLIISSAGCGPQWKKKFIRTRKGERAGPQPIFVLESEEKATYPPSTRYRQHYAYWKSWHTDLLETYGQLRKRDVRYLNGVIGEMRPMSELLSGEPGDRMKKILAEFVQLQEGWAKIPEPWAPSHATRTRLEQLRRIIDRDFHYSKVKKFLPPDP